MGQEDKTKGSGHEELLQKIIKQVDPRQSNIIIEQMKGQRGLLRPLAATLGKLLEDPVLRQAMDSGLPPGPKPHKDH